MAREESPVPNVRPTITTLEPQTGASPHDGSRQQGRLYVIWSIEHDAWLAPGRPYDTRWWAEGRCFYTRWRGGAAVLDDALSAAILQQANLVAVRACRIPFECIWRLP